MNGFAALAVKEAAVASGLGASLLPIAPSAIDGFAVGTLLSGLCLLLVMAPRRISRRRNRQATRNGVWANAPHPPVTPDLSAAPSAASTFPAASIVPAAPTHPAAANASSPFADESAEIVVAYPVRGASLLSSGAGLLSSGAGLLSSEASFQAPEVTLQGSEVSFRAPELKTAGRRSKHRLADADLLDRHDRRPEPRRGAGRHAAPSIGLSSRMASRTPAHPLATRD